MYAVVKTGGRQYRVAVGDVLEVGRLAGERGAAVMLPALLVVDGQVVTSAAAELAEIPVTGEVLEHTKGPKIKILKYKNKTGYRKRQGHRQGLTRVKVTGIGTDTPNAIDTPDAVDAGPGSEDISADPPVPPAANPAPVEGDSTGDTDDEPVAQHVGDPTAEAGGPGQSSDEADAEPSGTHSAGGTTSEQKD